MIFGPRHMQKLGSYVPTMFIYGTTGAIFGCYLTDWRVVMEYVPFYGSKFPEVKSEE